MAQSTPRSGGDLDLQSAPGQLGEDARVAFADVPYFSVICSFSSTGRHGADHVKHPLRGTPWQSKIGWDTMRIRRTQGGLAVQAIVGTHAAFLGFDLTSDARKGCLGFALYRVDHTENESYWLSGFKTFRSVEPNPSSTVIYPSNRHPIQSMWWGDYSVKPQHDYTYTIVPVYGTPASPVIDDDANSVSLDVSTAAPDTGVHGIYFNRGVAASQAYATKFGKKPSDLSPAKRA